MQDFNMKKIMDADRKKAALFQALANSEETLRKYPENAHYKCKLEADTEERKKQIAIYTAESEKLQKLLDEAQTRCRERTITPRDIIDGLQKVESHLLNLGTTKKAMEGITVIYNANAQEFPRAYKYTPMATFFKAIYQKNHWVLYDITREECASVRCKIDLTEAAKTAILSKSSIIR